MDFVKNILVYWLKNSSDIAELFLMKQGQLNYKCAKLFKMVTRSSSFVKYHIWTASFYRESDRRHHEQILAFISNPFV